MNDNESIKIWNIPQANFGACFHGEVWVTCPHCKEAHEMVGMEPEYTEGGWKVYRCSCGKLFKDR